jgi:chromosome segregation ATPase
LTERLEKFQLADKEKHGHYQTQLDELKTESLSFKKQFYVISQENEDLKQEVGELYAEQQRLMEELSAKECRLIEMEEANQLKDLEMQEVAAQVAALNEKKETLENDLYLGRTRMAEADAQVSRLLSKLEEEETKGAYFREDSTIWRTRCNRLLSSANSYKLQGQELNQTAREILNQSIRLRSENHELRVQVNELEDRVNQGMRIKLLQLDLTSAQSIHTWVETAGLQFQLSTEEKELIKQQLSNPLNREQGWKKIAVSSISGLFLQSIIGLALQLAK